MTLATKGTRRIVLDGSVYRWRVSADPDEVPYLLRPAIDTHSLIIEHPDAAGRTLTVRFDSLVFYDARGIPITPKLVSAVITAAVAQGWPRESSAPWRRYWKDARLLSLSEWHAERDNDAAR